MKHAGPDALAKLALLLDGVRKHAALREKKPGTFYRGPTAFLHFHEDPAGLFADLKVGKAFERFQVTHRSAQNELLKRIAKLLHP